MAAGLVACSSTPPDSTSSDDVAALLDDATATASDSDSRATSDTQDITTGRDTFIPLAPCRPVNAVPMPGQLALPCEPTQEACDGFDNDGDGFTDPHCESVACTSDADCTYGGALPDADCNTYAVPGCNQIDGLPVNGGHLCWGMLCPPGFKCIAGNCAAPGEKLPGETCTDGSECPLTAGCIPQSFRNITTAICVQYCHEYACPDGFTCVTEPSTSDHPVTHAKCQASFGCVEAYESCGGAIAKCQSDPTCREWFECAAANCSLEGTAPSACGECGAFAKPSPTMFAVLDCVAPVCETPLALFGCLLAMEPNAAGGQPCAAATCPAGQVCTASLGMPVAVCLRTCTPGTSCGAGWSCAAPNPSAPKQGTCWPATCGLATSTAALESP